MAEKKRSGGNTTSAGNQKKKKSKIVVFVVEIIVLVVLLGALWLLKDFGTTNAGENDGNGSATGSEKGPLVLVDFNEADVSIDQTVEQNEAMKGYWNIALFGVDSRTGALTKGTLSDCIIIASINQDTGDIKLVSVYRDNLLNLGNGKYGKCNSAYSAGGAEQALKMLNMNLDMDIRDFVTVGFEGLAATIDALGGVYIDVNSEELEHINNYQFCMAEDLHVSYVPVETTGYQLLNGLQATAYCRIRYKAGNDFARATAQREVIQAIADTAKKADLQTLTKVANDVAPYVYTSFGLDEIISLLGDVTKYSIVDEGGFPKEDARRTHPLGSLGDCVYSVNLEESVKWLHEFLFDDEDYEPSQSVKDISAYIHDYVSKYTEVK